MAKRVPWALKGLPQNSKIFSVVQVPCWYKLEWIGALVKNDGATAKSSTAAIPRRYKSGAIVAVMRNTFLFSGFKVDSALIASLLQSEKRPFISFSTTPMTFGNNRFNSGSSSDSRCTCTSHTKPVSWLLGARFLLHLTPAPAIKVACEPLIGHNSWTDWAREPVTHFTLHCYRIDTWAIRRPWLTFVNALANSILGRFYTAKDSKICFVRLVYGIAKAGE